MRIGNFMTRHIATRPRGRKARAGRSVRNAAPGPSRSVAERLGSRRLKQQIRMRMFDDSVERRGSYGDEWDRLYGAWGVDPEEGCGMGAADSEFRNAPPVL